MLCQLSYAGISGGRLGFFVPGPRRPFVMCSNAGKLSTLGCAHDAGEPVTDGRRDGRRAGCCVMFPHGVSPAWAAKAQVRWFTRGLHRSQVGWVKML